MGRRVAVMMEAPPDPSEASRAQLLAVIAQQQGVIATLEARIAHVEQRLGSGDGTGVPGTKPAAQRAKGSGRPRKQRDRGYARVRMAPTAVVPHAAEPCPDCGTRLRGGWVQRRREVIDRPPTPVRVTEHRILARTCPRCRRRVVPVAPLAGVVAGKQRLGARVVSLIVTLREATRLPVRARRWLLDHLYGLRLSVGAITAASDRVAACGQGEVRAIRARIRGSPWVQADETGWREHGRNGYAWTFCPPTDHRLPAARPRQDGGR